jgi:hypothetical protein
MKNDFEAGKMGLVNAKAADKIARLSQGAPVAVDFWGRLNGPMTGAKHG